MDAARLAFQAANSTTQRNIAHSSIPLILHQTWKNSHIDTWPDAVRVSVEKWLTYVVSDSMAYFLWEDDGVMLLLEEFEPDFVDRFAALPANVERPDVFRILVSKWIGGIVRIPSSPVFPPPTMMEFSCYRDEIPRLLMLFRY